MKTLKTTFGDFGPFTTIETLADRYRCDGIDYPFAVVGSATVDGTPPAPPPPPEPPEPAGPVVPESVPMLNAHLVIIQAGQMDALMALVEALPEMERQEAKAYLSLALNCRRDNKWVQLLGPGLGYDSAGLDQLFITADALKP